MLILALKKTMSQVKQQNWIYNNYEQEIVFFQKKGNALLQKINQHETILNQRKQQKLQPNQNDLNMLHQMVKTLLAMLTLINSYRYFQSINQPLTDKNEFWFYQIYNNYYLDTMKRFNEKLKTKVLFKQFLTLFDDMQ